MHYLEMSIYFIPLAASNIFFSTLNLNNVIYVQPPKVTIVQPYKRGKYFSLIYILFFRLERKLSDNNLLIISNNRIELPNVFANRISISYCHFQKPAFIGNHKLRVTYSHLTS
jgi:hypothetical protein